MLKPVQITTDEKELLEDWRRYGVNSLIRDRALSVLINSRGKSAHTISIILSRKESTIRSWLAKFKRQGLSSLFSKYLGNTNASKLTPTQKREIKEVLESKPSEYGIPKRFWEVNFLGKTKMKYSKPLKESSNTIPIKRFVTSGIMLLGIEVIRLKKH